jgi:hypothetical protein
VLPGIWICTACQEAPAGVNGAASRCAVKRLNSHLVLGHGSDWSAGAKEQNSCIRLTEEGSVVQGGESVGGDS